MLMEATHVDTCPEKDKYVVLLIDQMLIDQMYVREGNRSWSGGQCSWRSRWNLKMPGKEARNYSTEVWPLPVRGTATCITVIFCLVSPHLYTPAPTLTCTSPLLPSPYTITLPSPHLQLLNLKGRYEELYDLLDASVKDNEFLLGAVAPPWLVTLGNHLPFSFPNR